MGDELAHGPCAFVVDARGCGQRCRCTHGMALNSVWKKRSAYVRGAAAGTKRCNYGYARDDCPCAACLSLRP
jgi:hypothetical protein